MYVMIMNIEIAITDIVFLNRLVKWPVLTYILFSRCSNFITVHQSYNMSIFFGTSVVLFVLFLVET